MSRERPLVSVCIPAFNAERWIGAALESALGQTYAELELIVADNASTDATASIAREFADPRLRVETTSRTIGAVANHNRAVRLSRGAFVKFLHADDLLLPDCVEEMVALALEDPRIALVFAPREVLLEQASDPEWGQKFARPHERFEGLDRSNDGRVIFRQLLDSGFEENWIGEPSAVLVRRAALERVGLLNERLFQIADLELWARLAIDHRLGFVDRVLSVYRHHEQSGTAENARIGRDWFDRTWLLEGLLEIPNLTWKERTELVRLRRAALRRAFRAQIGRLARRRWTPELRSYAAYRASRRIGAPPRLHEQLDRVAAGARPPRLRLLVLAPFPPSPEATHGGARVAAQLLDRLAERVDVALLCLRNDWEVAVGERLEQRLDLVLEVPRRDDGRSLGRRLVRGFRSRVTLLLGRPMWTDDVAEPAFGTALREIGDRWAPDLVVILYPVMGCYLNVLSRLRAPRVLIEPDPASHAAAERAQWQPVWGRAVHRLDGRAWNRFERRVLRDVDAVVVFTEDDRATLADPADGTPIVCIPFGTDFIERPASPVSNEPNLLFVGSFLHAPNLDAAMRLARDIFPRVRSRRRDARLFLVGDRPPRELATADGVVVTGVVPDLAPYFADAAVVVAPVRLGGGMRVKVVEALAAGKAVVASPLAIAGLPLEDGEHLLVAEDDGEFAERIAQLLDDPLLRRDLGTAARAWAEEHLGWEPVVEEHVRLYRRLGREL